MFPFDDVIMETEKITIKIIYLRFGGGGGGCYCQYAGIGLDIGMSPNMRQAFAPVINDQDV